MKIPSRSIALGALLVTTASLTIAADTSPLAVPARGFISSQPAKTWEEGLISGNGMLGTNVLSRPLDERIIFTHKHLFLPQGPPLMPPDSSARLFEIRKLIDRGLYSQATQLAFDLSGQDGFMYPDAFVPAFDMSIRMEPGSEVRDYARSMDFQTGVATVHWADDRGAFERHVFVSRADGVAVIDITGPAPGTINCTVALQPRNTDDNPKPREIPHSNEIFKSHVSDIVTRSNATSLTYRNRFTKAYPGSIHALEGLARVTTTGGTATPAEDGSLAIKNADRVLILVDISLLYDPDQSKTADMNAAMAKLPADYKILLDRQVKVHGKLFNRMRLDLGGGADHQRTTEDLLAASSYENLNRALIEKQFDAGRYNIISCTGDLPPCLQGGWGGTYNPGWASDFTHNGNVPSAIAANLMGNMPELMLAYTSYIESLVPWMEINAKHMFGARGVVLPSRSTTNGFNNALAPQFAGGFWVAGAGWAAHFFYDYYLYTGDRKFLAEHALPFMEKVALFFEDYLVEGPDGKWVFSPTQSPENDPGNSKSQGTFNATMDVAVAKELLQNIVTASRELGKNRDKIPLWQEMLRKMPDYAVDDNGIIKEWLTPRLTNNDSHRHSSQLYPLFDGLPKEIERSPALLAGFKKSIEYKLDKHWKNNQAGFMSFGLVQLGQAATSLGEGELAYHCLKHLVNRFWLNNLASMHNHRSLFNMDISGGMPAVIIKMLVSSEPGKVRLLPALPAAWPTGTLEGALCRNAIEVRSLHWDKQNINVTLVSNKDQMVTLEVPTQITKIAVTRGTAVVHPGNRPDQRLLKLTAKEEVSLEIIRK